MRIILALLILCNLVLLTGCQTNPVSSEPPPDAPSPSAPQPDSTAPGDTPSMPPTIPTPPATGAERLIEMAKEDLAQRLSIPTAEIKLVQILDVTWPDSSLGCPQEGMLYAQVLTPGYLILLEHGGEMVEYHTSRGSTVVTCENPSPPLPGAPDNT